MTLLHCLVLAHFEFELDIPVLNQQAALAQNKCKIEQSGFTKKVQKELDT